MRKIYLLLLCLYVINVSAQTTYTWNVSRGDWTTPASWTPARNTPAANDILVFNGTTFANACAINVPGQTISKLRLINNANVRFIAGARLNGTGTIARSSTAVTGTGTLFTTELLPGDLLFHTASATFTGEVASIASGTSLVVSSAGTIGAGTTFSYSPSINMNDGSSTALDIQAGSTLTLGDALPAESLMLRVLTGSKASIQGTVRLLYARNRVVGMDSASVIVKSGALIRTDSSFTGNPFLSVGTANTVIFQAGSNFEALAGANPFALTAPLSKVLFEKGSNYYQTSTLIPSISGRSFGNFIFNTSTITATQNATASFDSLIVQQGVFTLTSSGTTSINAIAVTGGILNMNVTAGNMNITGNTNISAAGRLNLNGKFITAPANINFNGAVQQKISGTGSLRIAVTADSAVTLHIQNKTGVLLEKNIDLNAAILSMDSGFINLNTNTLNIGSSTLQGRATQLNGYITGTGTLTRWYIAALAATGDSTLLPAGANGQVYPVWVSGTPSAGGSVSLNTLTVLSGGTTISPSYYDTATSAGIIVNKRLNHSWALSTANGLAGTAMNVRISAPAPSGYVSDVTKMRVTLSNSIAPGTLSEDGSGTLLQPVAGKTGLTVLQLNNTFYMGSNGSNNTLPVTFINVSAQNTGKANLVLWSTASESNLAYFDVEKAADGRSFSAVGRIRPGNSATVKQYEFTDLAGGSATYRISAVHADGTLDYSRLVYVTAQQKQPASVAYPNPVSDYVNILSANGANLGTDAKLYNYLGKEIGFTVAPQGIDVKDLIPGVYYLHVSHNNTTEIVKFVKHD